MGVVEQLACDPCTKKLDMAKRGKLDPTWIPKCEHCTRKLEQLRLPDGMRDHQWCLPEEKGGPSPEVFEKISRLMGSGAGEVLMELGKQEGQKDDLEFTCGICGRHEWLHSVAKLMRVGANEVLMDLAYAHKTLCVFRCVTCGARVDYDTATGKATVPAGPKVIRPNVAPVEIDIFAADGPGTPGKEFLEFRGAEG